MPNLPMPHTSVCHCHCKRIPIDTTRRQARQPASQASHAVSMAIACHLRCCTNRTNPKVRRTSLSRHAPKRAKRPSPSRVSGICGMVAQRRQKQRDRLFPSLGSKTGPQRYWIQRHARKVQGHDMNTLLQLPICRSDLEFPHSRLSTSSQERAGNEAPGLHPLRDPWVRILPSDLPGETRPVMLKPFKPIFAASGPFCGIASIAYSTTCSRTCNDQRPNDASWKPVSLHSTHACCSA